MKHGRPEEMGHRRYRRVDRMKEPKNGYFRGREIRQRCLGLAALFAETSALCDQDLDELPKKVREPYRGRNLQDRRDILIRDLVLTGWRALKLSDLHGGEAVTQLIIENDPQITFSESHRLLVCPASFIFNERPFL